MVELKPSYLQELCYTAQEDRLMLAGLVCGEGVSDVVGGSLLVTTGGSGLNVSVAQGGCFIEGVDDDRGMYWCYNDAPVTVTLAAANGTNPRIDQIIARLYDTTYGEGADEWVLEKLDGTPTAGATLANGNGAATLPDNSVLLAYVLVPAAFAGPFVDATHILDYRSEFVSCGQPYAPYVELNASAPTSVGHNALTKVDLATVVHNDSEFFSVTNSVVTILRPGWYDLWGRDSYSTGGVSLREVSIGKNGLTTKLAFSFDSDAGSFWAGEASRPSVPLNFGDTIQLVTKQQSGGTISDDGSGALVIRKVG